jgi:hypothetical protein
MVTFLSVIAQGMGGNQEKIGDSENRYRPD